MRLAKLLFSMPNAICIAGNHEYDFVKHYRALMTEAQDYDTVLDKLRNRFEDGRLLDWETVDAIDSLPFYAEGQNFIGVHAGVPIIDGKALHPSKATGEQLVYDRRFKDEDVLPEEQMRAVRAYARQVLDEQRRNRVLSAQRRKDRQPEHRRLLQSAFGHGRIFERRLGVRRPRRVQGNLCRTAHELSAAKRLFCQWDNLGTSNAQKKKYVHSVLTCGKTRCILEVRTKIGGGRV